MSLSMSFEDSLYVLGTNLLSDVICKYYLPVCGLSFIVLISFTEQVSNFDIVKFIKFLLYESCF